MQYVEVPCKDNCTGARRAAGAVTEVCSTHTEVACSKIFRQCYTRADALVGRQCLYW
jgi:hypothetical protein